LDNLWLCTVDALTLCNYNVTAIENGRIAKDELLKENACFDLILLNLYIDEKF